VLIPAPFSLSLGYYRGSEHLRTSPVSLSGGEKEPLFLIPVIPGLMPEMACVWFIIDRFMPETENQQFCQFCPNPLSHRG